jgi:NADPH-dependent F420 reductase
VRIGILGGTGNMGRGLAARLALKHEILIGSRSLAKAQRIARELNNLSKGFYQAEMQGNITGLVNSEAARDPEIVVVALPPEAAIPVIRDLSESFGREHIVISTVVPMTRRNRLYYWAPLKGGDTTHDGRSAAELIQEVIEPTPVVSAFQTVPAAYLNNIDAVLNVDVLIAGNDELAVAKVSSLVRDIPNLRPLRVGPLENSKWIESITPLLLNAAILNGLHDPTIRVVPWMPTDHGE